MKPKLPGLAAKYGAQFKDEAVVAAYETRPPYPEALFPKLIELCGGGRPRILDLGCGPGEVARRLAPNAQRITSVDHSEAMIRAARALPGADAPNLEWLVGPVEEAPLSGPYDAAIAAESFHWFDWETLCPRLVEVVPSARLVMIDGRSEHGSPWQGELFELIRRYSTNRDFERYDLVTELEDRSCFALEGRADIETTRFRQSIDDYVTCLHSRNGFSRDRMTVTAASMFDADVRALVLPHARDGQLELDVTTRLVWGRVRA